MFSPPLTRLNIPSVLSLDSSPRREPIHILNEWTDTSARPQSIPRVPSTTKSISASTSYSRTSPSNRSPSNSSLSSYRSHPYSRRTSQTPPTQTPPTLSAPGPNPDTLPRIHLPVPNSGDPLRVGAAPLFPINPFDGGRRRGSAIRLPSLQSLSSQHDPYRNEDPSPTSLVHPPYSRDGMSAEGGMKAGDVIEGSDPAKGDIETHYPPPLSSNGRSTYTPHQSRFTDPYDYVPQHPYKQPGYPPQTLSHRNPYPQSLSQHRQPGLQLQLHPHVYPQPPPPSHTPSTSRRISPSYPPSPPLRNIHSPNATPNSNLPPPTYFPHSLPTSRRSSTAQHHHPSLRHVSSTQDPNQTHHTHGPGYGIARSRSHSSISGLHKVTKEARLDIERAKAREQEEMFGNRAEEAGIGQNRRLAHLMSEQKRRESINIGFTALRHTVPNATQNDSKAVILRKAAHHITYLESLLYQAGIAFSAGTQPPTPTHMQLSREGSVAGHLERGRERGGFWSRRTSPEKVDIVMREAGDGEGNEEVVRNGRGDHILHEMKEDDANEGEEENMKPRGWDGMKIGGVSL